MDGEVWWTSVCGNRSHYDAFWSPSVTLETTSPDLTLCFQKTVLLWLPCGWLWLAAPFQVYTLWTRPTKHAFCSYSKLNFIKTLCGFLLTVVALLSLIRTTNDLLTRENEVPAVDLTFEIVRILTLILVTSFMRWEFQKGVHTSGVLSIFWATYILSQIVGIRSAAMRREAPNVWRETDVMLAIDITFFVLVVIEFLASAFADPAALDTKPTKLLGEKQPLLAKTTQETSGRDGKPLPELTASFWNKTTFQWLLPSVVRGYRKTVTFDDLYDVRPEDRCVSTMPIFFGTYNRSVHKDPGGRLRNVQNAFWKALFNTVGWPLLMGLMLKYLSVALFLANPQLLRLLLQTIEEGGEEQYAWKSTALAVAIFLTALCGSVVRHNFFYIGWNTGLQARSVVNAVVCRKALLLGGASKRSTTVGEMVNFLSVDAQKLQDMFTFSHLILDVPIQLTATCALMWTTIGWSTSAGLALLLVVVPLNGFFFGNTVRKLQGKQMIHKDSRLRIINEILNGIKILKLYAWEHSFSGQVRTSREEEIRYIKYANIISAISHTMWCVLPYLTSLAIFAVFTLTSPSHILTADTAFVTLSYINTLQFPLANLPLGVNFLGQGIVSGNRLARFLELDELRQDSVEQNPSTSDAVRVDDGTFCWEPEGRPILEDINLRVKRGQLVAIVGHVGAGKSSLLSTILGEMVKAQGSVTLNGTLAYVPQQAWIRNASVKNNILFGKPLDGAKYSGVLDACSLTQDLTILPGGDLTEIGEKGINLSGGQKQRVSLARAVYQDEDIYLLDDPLSAVDAHVGKHIFDNVIGKKGLLKDKTRILVTHAITFLPNVDLIVVINGGHVTEMGQYKELLENDGAFADFLHTYLVEHEDDASSGTDFAELRRQLSTASGTDSDSSTKLKRQVRSRCNTSRSLSTGPDPLLADSGTKIVKKSILILEETSAEGRLKLNVIKRYIRAGGILPFIVVICSQLLFVASQVATNLWLSDWTTDRPVNGTISREHLNYRLTMYGVFGIVQTVSALSLMTTAAMGCTYASRNLHASLLYRILRAPMAFFDTTPLGRIMNRFSKDMDMIDANVPLYLRSWLFATGPLISTIVLVSYTTPFFIVVLVILGIPFVFTQRAYIIYASQLKRIDAVRRSPIYAHFDETVAGATSIRAYRRQGAFIDEADHLIDNSQKPYSLMSSVQRWLGVTMETMGSLVILCATLFAVAQKDSIGAGLAGVSITYALQITTLLNTMIRSSTELETYMISVERIDEYSNVDTEAPWELPDEDVPQDWPQEGALTFNQYGTRYRPGLDLVLSKVNLDIQPTEKVGVVGRTGAGKSSLTLALFRIIEAAEGSISIDGLDISKVGLHKLRQKLTVIPQDPVMFVGSMRFNLDPFGLYSDHDIWEALEHAHLKDFVESLEEGLQYECGEGGDALSVGQRQLVCLARALLRRSMILVLDEATAAVDLETDALIQVSIRKHFKDCTVITVAHRLNTVLDYDRILVLDHGRVKEFDTPGTLLANKKSIFHSLAKEAGLA